VEDGVRLGVFDHFGWAVAIVAAGAEVVDRRRIALVGPGVTSAPIHYESAGLSDEATAALVARVRASIARAAGDALGDLPAGIRSISLRIWPPDFPEDIAVQRRAPYEARADAIMYRQELAELARARGWEVHLYDAKAVERQATALAGPDILERPRAALGPPWTKDHRVALAAAIVAGAGPPASAARGNER
jgi:hypothetical protein